MNWFQANAVALVGYGVNVVGFIAAASMVVWQLGKQHKNSLVQQRENAREALKLRIYEALVQRIRTCSDAFGEAKMYAFGILPAIDSFQREQSAGYQPSPLKQRVPTFSELHSKAQGQLAELIVEFECWSIALPALNVFRIALNAANYDVGESFPPLFSALLHILPMDPPPGQTGNTIIHPPPSPDAFSALKHLIEEYKGAMDEMGCYIDDLTKEAQNNLLHGLFEGKVPPRQPLDPRHKVISAIPEKAQVLIRYFETETRWGKHMAVINAEVKAEVQAKAAVQSGPK